MTITVTGLKALGRVVSQKTQIDAQIPVEMQMALLRLAVSEKERSADPQGLVDALEMTEQSDENGEAQEKRRAG